MLLKRSQPTV